NAIIESNTLEKELKNELKMVQRISKDSLNFMDDLLNMHGAFRNEDLASTDLLELVDYCVSFMQLRADEKKQQIILNGEHVFVPIFRERIWRVLNNLISNAIKFSPIGGEITINLTESDTHVRVEVKDQGVGIPEKMKKQVFDIMGDAKRMGTAGERSFGLGLAISMQIMQAHQGRIWFESTENEGASFFIEVPKVHDLSQKATESSSVSI
ncbi:MAG: HAMP domain-containing histidine kinase, partial [Bacteroidota bacterium]|nr:HAMP domain-containing histidine kinase [Bacteroidota bacterium]MDX5431733.1 HAMP domain-containing histidine kinase [Bacteroidota bacterium]MDX5470448.1 HAMP domain-containing histidine kinase [Bacteroidota bacterium]